MILSPIDVSYFGRKVKYAGDREFPDWSVTIYNDEDFYVRKILEKWSNAMNTLVSNVMGNDVYPTDYKTSAIVYQYAKNGEIAAAYRFEGLFPTQIDGIQVDWEAANQVEQFECTFAFDYWEPETVAIASDVDYTTTTAEDGIAERRVRTTLG